MASFFPAALILLAIFFNPFASEVDTATSLIASIDCGSPTAYTDDLGIPWTSDSSLINSGQRQTVLNAASLYQPMRTLRVFPTGKRNCYTLKVPGGGQVLVRASFFYGDYDGKMSPPTFDLEFDGNSWSMVETLMDTIVFHEVIYVPTANVTSVCVVQANAGDLPFISAIEVRGLEDIMYRYYDRTSSALVLSFREAVGLAAAVRYPDDPYDRKWLPYQSPNTVDVVQNKAPTVNTSISDSPPEAIFQSAVTPISGSNMLSLTAPLPSYTVNAYVNMYFTETSLLADSDSRAFQVYVDNTAASDTLVPTFGGSMEFYYVNYSASSSTEIRLEATADATLPPVLSAMEAYIIISLAGRGGSNAPAPGGEDSPSQASDQANNPPTAKRVPVSSAFGGKGKATPSFGCKVNVGRFLEIGVGMIFPIFFFKFV